MILFNVYSDNYNYKIPYKHEDGTIYVFRSFKSDQDWTIETKKYSDSIDLFFNDNTESDSCNNFTELTRHPMTKKHYYSLMKFIFKDKIK